MPNRVLKDSIRTNPKVDSLTWFEEVVFYRLIVSADDYGCYDGRVSVIKNTLFPAKDNITNKSIEKALRKLVNVGLLCMYTVNDIPYVFFPSWSEHQQCRAQRRKYPKPTADNIDITCNQMISDDIKCLSNPIQSNPIQSNPIQRDNTRKKFAPPTFAEVETYCAQRGNKVDPKKFFDYFSTSGWVDSTGKPVRNWKQKVIAWEGREWKHGEGSKPRVDMEQDRESDGKWKIAYDVE